jgi:TRAP transporter 4TM/12TM fusion protein
VASDTPGARPDFREEGTPRRDLTGLWRVLFLLVVLGAAGFHLYTGAFGLLASHVQITVHWAFMSFLILLLYHYKASSVGGYRPWFDVALGIGSVAANVYLIMTVEDRILGIGVPTPLELFLGTIAIVVVLEAARRTTGPVLPITCIVLILYALFGNHLPNLIAHRGFETESLIAFLYMSPEGIFSLPLAISASYIILFILFGAMLAGSGGGRLFTDSAYALAGTRRGGPAKTAVVSSALMGTISGSAVANVVMTGTFTIPLMKSSGVRPVMAGATEAVASTGGSIMPPIMGAAAFIMAEYLNIPYRDVAIAAIFPAVIYYLTLYWMVDLNAAKEGLVGLPRDQLPKVSDVFWGYGHLLAPLVGLIAMLLYGWSPLKSAFYSIVLLVFAALVHPRTRAFAHPSALLKSLENGITGALPVAAATAAAGIIVGVLSLTGLGAHFAAVMSTLAGDSLFLALVLTMIACIILGCGMPISAVYIIMASLTVPTLVRLGLDPLPAHMFIFYYSCIAAITPPVALASYAAAGIANANPHAVGMAALRIGIVAFVVPYMFAYAPSLLLLGSATDILIACIPALLGCYMIAVGVQGYSITRHGSIERVLAFGGGLLLVKPGLLTDALGLLCLVIVATSAVWRRRRDAAQDAARAPYGTGERTKTA